MSRTGAVTIGARTLAPGTYRIAVTDRSSVHNFHLLGPAVNRRTGRPFVGSTSWTVALQRGTYRYGSDASRVPMKSLTVK